MAQTVPIVPTQDRQTGTVQTGWARLLLTTIIGLGAILRIYQLEANGLWVDEIFTALFSAPDKTWLEVARGPLDTPLPTPPLWFWLTHIFQKVFGTSDTVVRLPAVLFGTGGIGILYLTAQVLFKDRRIALVAALLLALSPTHIHYSREARFYPAIVLLSLVTVLCLYQGTTIPQRSAKQAWGWWLGFTIASLLNIYLHLTTLLVLAAELIFAGLFLSYDLLRNQNTSASPTTGSRHDRAQPVVGKLHLSHIWMRVRRGQTFALHLTVAVVVIALAYLPMVEYLVAGARDSRGLGATGEIRGFELSLHYFFELMATFGAGGGIAFTLFAATAVWGVWHAWRDHSRVLMLLVTICSVPFIVIAVTRPKHWFSYKYVITLLPIYLMLVSLGIVQLTATITAVLRSLRPVDQAHKGLRFLFVLLVLPYAIVSWPSAVEQATQIRPNRWRNMSKLLLANGQPDDVVAVLDIWDRIMPAAQILSYYGPTDENATVVSITDERQLQPLLDRYSRVWLVADLAVELEATGTIAGWIESHPNVPLDMERGAIVYLIQASASQADLLATAESLVLPTPAAFSSIAKAYAAHGMPAEAEQLYQRALAADPQNAAMYLGLGNLYVTWGRLSEAKAAYQQALALNPIAEFHAVMANAYAQAGYRKQAIIHYSLAIDLFWDQHNKGGRMEAEEWAILQAWQNAQQQLQVNE